MPEDTLTQENVRDVLKNVYDPEIPINVLDLGLIYEVKVDEGNVYVQMTLTAPGCGMGPMIAQQAEWAISELDGVEVRVRVEGRLVGTLEITGGEAFDRTWPIPPESLETGFCNVRLEADDYLYRDVQGPDCTVLILHTVSIAP